MFFQWSFAHRFGYACMRSSARADPKGGMGTRSCYSGLAYVESRESFYVGLRLPAEILANSPLRPVHSDAISTRPASPVA